VTELGVQGDRARPGKYGPGKNGIRTNKEPARTVGFGKWDSARTVGFGKRDSARTVGFGNQAASARAHGTWFSGLGISTLGPGKFQDMVFRTWDLIFGAWIFTLAVSKTET
jgi:hypothetical protein